ncbi:hypothetical protein JTB14_003903 [Gonioctena quinquepunctata]|nr:hypothetical protein JTB14_003903 [Gonioctena quinquepunctata]
MIYEENMNLHKKLHLLNSDNINFLECNNLIRRSNYSRNGVGLKPVVARLLSIEILKRIHELNHRRGKQKSADVIRDNQDNAKKRSGAPSTFLGQAVTLTTSTPVGSTDPKILL